MIGVLPEDDPSPEEDEEEEEEVLIAGPDVDDALSDEPDDEDERACGAGCGAGPPDDGAACGEGSGFGVACAMPGSAIAIPTATSATVPKDRVTKDAVVTRAVRVSEPLRRVPQLSRTPTSPSQL